MLFSVRLLWGWDNQGLSRVCCSGTTLSAYVWLWIERTIYYKEEQTFVSPTLVVLVPWTMFSSLSESCILTSWYGMIVSSFSHLPSKELAFMNLLVTFIWLWQMLSWTMWIVGKQIWNRVRNPLNMGITLFKSIPTWLLTHPFLLQ